MTSQRDRPDLVADIGGTHVRFGRVGASGRVEEQQTLLCADHVSITAAARNYLEAAGGPVPRQAAFAAAGPVGGDRFQMTNHVWSFSIEEVRQELGLERLVLLNDFAALVLAVPALGGEELHEIRPGEPMPGAPIAVLGPGTGLGVAALVPAGEAWIPLATEGGHRDLAATNEREWQIVSRLAERFGNVSAERALSGPGLVNLYEVCSRLAGKEPQRLTPAAVTAGARQRSSPACIEAAELFSGWLGAVAGDLALTLGARGGVYLGGGMLSKMDQVFDADRFRERFLAKGRFRPYLEPIPVRAIVNRHATLIGAARALGTAS